MTELAIETLFESVQAIAHQSGQIRWVQDAARPTPWTLQVYHRGKWHLVDTVTWNDESLQAHTLRFYDGVQHRTVAGLTDRLKFPKEIAGEQRTTA